MKMKVVGDKTEHKTKLLKRITRIADGQSEILKIGETSRWLTGITLNYSSWLCNAIS